MRAMGILMLCAELMVVGGQQLSRCGWLLLLVLTVIVTEMI
jgi:hypothetical protein